MRTLFVLFGTCINITMLTECCSEKFYLIAFNTKLVVSVLFSRELTDPLLNLDPEKGKYYLYHTQKLSVLSILLEHKIAVKVRQQLIILFNALFKVHS